MSVPIKTSPLGIIPPGPKININVSDEEISDLKDLYATEPPSSMHYSLYYNEYLNFMYGMEEEMNRLNNQYKIKNIKFNGPKVIVFWESGDKTIVTVQDDENGYDVEKAIMAAYMKKALSNNKSARDRSINNVFDKWIPVYEDQKEDIEAQINKVKERKNKKKENNKTRVWINNL